MSDRAVIYRDQSENRRQRWRYRVLAGNNEVIDASEPYLTKWNCKRALLKRHPDIEWKDLSKDKDYSKYPPSVT